MVKYKLTYFNLMGLGEPIRLLFAYLGQEFEDVRIERADWPKHKQNFPYGQLPVLEVDGKVVCQSSAICRYLGKKAGLAGQDDWEALQIDMVVDIFHDFRVDFSKYIREADPAAKEKHKEVLFKEKIPFYFGKLEEMLKNNGGYFVNGKLSWADLVITCMCQTMCKATNEQITEKYPGIHQLVDKVNTHPKLKVYITNRPVTEL